MAGTARAFWRRKRYLKVKSVDATFENSTCARARTILCCARTILHHPIFLSERNHHPLHARYPHQNTNARCDPNHFRVISSPLQHPVRHGADDASPRQVVSPSRFVKSPHQVASPSRLTKSHHQVASPSRLAKSPRQVASPSRLDKSPRQVASPSRLAKSPR